MSKRDPFLLEPDDVKTIESGLKSSNGGIICPKMNKLIGKPCKVCDSLQPLWQYPKGHPKRELAVQKKAKVNFYMNIVLPDNPAKSYILEIGKLAGNDIIAGIKQRGWTDIIHPKANMGRELQVTKSISDGRNKYSVSPKLEKADYDIPDSVLENLPNLDNIIDMIRNDELNDDNFIRVSSLKHDDTLVFRMCPPAKNSTVFARVPIAYVFRHWGGVTQAEVDGKDSVNLSLPEENIGDDSAPEPESDGLWESSSETAKGIENTHTSSNEREPCFGQPEFFDSKDEDCRACQDFKECKKACRESL